MRRKKLKGVPELEALKDARPPAAAEESEGGLPARESQTPPTLNAERKDVEHVARETPDLTLHVPAPLMRTLLARADREGIPVEALVLRMLESAEMAREMRGNARPERRRHGWDPLIQDLILLTLFSPLGRP